MADDDDLTQWRKPPNPPRNEDLRAMPEVTAAMRPFGDRELEGLAEGLRTIAEMGLNEQMRKALARGDGEGARVAGLTAAFLRAVAAEVDLTVMLRKGRDVLACDRYEAEFADPTGQDETP